MFVDRVRINVRGGAGGAGVAAFQRQKGRPRGKPIGGSGGSGGDVVLVADPDVTTLLRYDRRPHWEAPSGTHGEGDLKHGKRGDDLILSVPLGTVVYDEEGRVLADLVEPGQRLVVATGGRGGRGNAALVSPRRKVPTYAEQGEYGESRWITLELKLVADAALVGYPNAGKSTFISRVSAAKPKIADYPFTTLTPHLGVVSVGGREFVLADIPGLIEGAAEGKGLGHEFLRHVERARVLVFLLDPTPVQVDPVPRQYEVLRHELARHSEDLASRPRVIAVNKVDAIDDATREEILAWARSEGITVHLVSAVTGEGIDPLLHAIADLVDTVARAAPQRAGFVLHRPVDVGFTVRRDGDRWIVEGRQAIRAVALDDLTKPEAADLAAERLRRIGVDEALAHAGAQPGDEVQIGDLVFEYHADDAPAEGVPAEEVPAEPDGGEAGATRP